jgi:hypothetical protein
MSGRISGREGAGVGRAGVYAGIHKSLSRRTDGQKKGEKEQYVEMTPTATLPELFDKVVLPIKVKKEYILLIR